MTSSVSAEASTAFHLLSVIYLFLTLHPILCFITSFSLFTLFFFFPLLFLFILRINVLLFLHLIPLSFVFGVSIIPASTFIYLACLHVFFSLLYFLPHLSFPIFHLFPFVSPLWIVFLSFIFLLYPNQCFHSFLAFLPLLFPLPLCHFLPFISFVFSSFWFIFFTLQLFLLSLLGILQSSACCCVGWWYVIRLLQTHIKLYTHFHAAPFISSRL